MALEARALEAERALQHALVMAKVRDEEHKFVVGQVRLRDPPTHPLFYKSNHLMLYCVAFDGSWDVARLRSHLLFTFFNSRVLLDSGQQCIFF